MSRPKPKDIEKIRVLIQESLRGFLINEVIEPIETDFETIIGDNEFGYKLDRYVFRTDKNNEYTVNFYYETLKDKDKLVPAIAIGFGLMDTNNTNDTLVGTLDDEFIQRTNYNEQFEVLGKVIYLISKFINSNPNIKNYLIYKNTWDSNLRVYKLIYNKLFKDNFKLYDLDDDYLFKKN